MPRCVLYLRAAFTGQSRTCRLYLVRLYAQFYDRLLIMLMPVKYQPDYIYLRHCKVRRVHLFTVIQFFCFVAMWVIKSVKTTSITFPLMVNTPSVCLPVCLSVCSNGRSRGWLDSGEPPPSRVQSLYKIAVYYAKFAKKSFFFQITWV